MYANHVVRGRGGAAVCANADLLTYPVLLLIDAIFYVYYRLTTTSSCSATYVWGSIDGPPCPSVLVGGMLLRSGEGLCTSSNTGLDKLYRRSVTNDPTPQGLIIARLNSQKTQKGHKKFTSD